MSNEHVLGSIGWSPDFKSQPDPLGPVKFVGNTRLDEDVLKILAPQPKHLRPLDVTSDGVSEPQSTQEVESVNLLVAVGESREVIFLYTNWKGETATRRAVFTRLFWGSNEWHSDRQLLIDGYDCEKGAFRTFAAKDISDVRYA